MMRPMTCLSLVAALGAGLYLYQEKHNAHLLDRDIDQTMKQADQARDRIGLLKAEWALLNEPERLQSLANEHLQLQPLQPTQFARLEDLPSRLPPVSATPVNTAPDDVPVAAAAPMPPPAPAARPTLLASAAPEEPVPLPHHEAPPVKPLQPVGWALNPPPVAAAHPRALPVKPRERERDYAAARPEPEPRPFLAPVMPAYAPAPVVIHAPTVQTAAAMAPPAPSPYVGSALGMARTPLAAPVPVANAASLGYASGQ